MIYSTLYAVPHPLQGALTVIENGEPTVAFIVGSDLSGNSICHGQPGEHIPDDATVYRDGTTAWTWNEVIAEYPDLATCVVPHEYAGEPTAANLDTASFTRCLTPDLL